MRSLEGERGHKKFKERFTPIPSDIVFGLHELDRLYSKIGLSFPPELFVGTKGLGLMQMKQWGLPVPDGFVITSFACSDLNDWKRFKKRRFPHQTGRQTIHRDIDTHVARLEMQTGKTFGDKDNPLFVSTRSGAKESMPGLMDTVLYVGLTDQTFPALVNEVGLAKATKHYVKLILQLSGVPKEQIGELLETIQTDIAEDDARAYISKAMDLFHQQKKYAFPQDVRKQLRLAITTIASSWFNKSAKAYRKKNGIPEWPITACVVQEMISVSPSNPLSGSGVVLTADPHTNEQIPIVDFVRFESGDTAVGDSTRNSLTWETLDHAVRIQLEQYITIMRQKIIETYRADKIQDVEFTVDRDGKVHLLQRRDAKMEPLAKLNALLDLVDKQIISIEDATRMMPTSDAKRLLHPTYRSQDIVDARNRNAIIASGLAPCSGSFAGKVVYSLDEARSTSDVVVLVADLTLAESAQIPENVRAIVCGTFGIGSHGSRHLESFADKHANIPVLISANTQRLIIEKPPVCSVYVDGFVGEVIPYLLPIDEPPHLLERQRRFLNDVIAKKAENPWKYVIKGPLEDTEFSLPPFVRSVKAMEQLLMYNFIDYRIIEPSSIHCLYEIGDDGQIRGRDRDEFRKAVRSALCESIVSNQHDPDANREATIRTCHSPQAPGGSPWFVFKTQEDVEAFFASGKFEELCNFPFFDPETGLPLSLDSIIVTSIHAGKLDKSQAKNHFCASVMATNDGTIVIQITPGEPHLRKVGKPDETGKIKRSVILEIEPGEMLRICGREAKRVGFDELYEDDKGLWEMATAAVFEIEHLLVNYWVLHAMAHINNHLPPGLSSPSLQLQGRMLSDNSIDVWVYGLNCDTK